MIEVVALAAVFLIMVFWPFLLSSLFNSREKIQPLYVGADNVKNPRYFAVSFCDKMDHALAEAAPDSQTIRLSHDESLLRGNGVPFDGRAIDTVVFEEGDFSANSCAFTKEVYAIGDVLLSGKCEVRALASRGYACLEDETKVIRWLDAGKGVKAGRNCDAGMSLTSKGPVVVGRGTRFHRLFGSMIYAGDDLPSEKAVAAHPVARGPREKMPEFQVDRVEVDEVYPHTIITATSLKLSDRCTVEGDVKSERSVRVMTGATVTGGVFADGGIVIEPGACVQGDVFSQEDVVIAAGAVVGVRGCIRSVVARKSVYLQEGATVYGYVGSEDESFVVDGDAYNDLANARY